MARALNQTRVAATGGIAEGDEETVPLQHADGQQQDGPGGHGVGEGNGAQRQHQQQGGQHDEQAVAAVDGHAAGQDEQARADEAVDAGQQIRPPVQGRLEVLGGKAALHQEGGQPGHPVEGDADADEEDQQAKGVLTPGMETGSRKGTVSSTQNSSMPCSPTRASIWRRLMWLSSMAWAVALRVSESVLWGR